MEQVCQGSRHGKLLRVQEFTITDSNNEVSTDEDVQRLNPNATLWALVREGGSHMAPMRASPRTLFHITSHSLDWAMANVTALLRRTRLCTPTTAILSQPRWLRVCLVLLHDGKAVSAGEDQLSAAPQDTHCCWGAGVLGCSGVQDMCCAFHAAPLTTPADSPCDVQAWA